MSKRTIEAQRSSDSSWLTINNQQEDYYSYYRAVNKNGPARIDDITSSQGYVYKHDAADRRHTDSLEFGRLSTDDSASRRLVCPPHLICFLSVTLNENANGYHVLSNNKSVYFQPLRTRWQEGLVYPTLNSIAEHRVGSKVLSPRRYYLRSGYARLLEWSNDHFVEVDYHEVETEAHWNTYVTQMIARYCGQGVERLPFYLELNSDFEWFAVEPIPRQTYSKSVGNALVKTALKNFEGRHYWSKSVMKRMFDEPTIERIVDEDCKMKALTWEPPLSDQEKDRFVQWLFDDRWRFLAIFIRGNLDLSSLHKLMLVNEPITGSEVPLSNDILDCFLMPTDAVTFRDKQAGFRPINFPELGEPKHMDVKPDELVPIHFEESDLVGDGGSGNVYRASIHSNYHTFSRNKSEKFALKVLRNSEMSQGRREISVWEDIVTQPHPHILWFHASWSQKDQFYMLSPLAEGNLSKHLMDDDSRFDPVRDLRWFLEQVEGLASGIDHIHNIGRKKVGLQKLMLERKTDYGYHHDLKPDNILIFSQKRSSRKKWVISDFGTVKLRQVVSHASGGANSGGVQLAPGDPRYGGPERFAGLEPEKPYDIWSFGCILLEILLWTFGHGGSGLSKFYQERCNETAPVQCHDCKDKSAQEHGGSVGTNIGDSKRVNTGDFWYICRKQGHHLRPSVVEKLDLVKSEAPRKCAILVPLCKLVPKMLSINPEKRPTASTIVEEIGSMRWQAEKIWGSGRANERVSKRISAVQVRQSPTGSPMLPRLSPPMDQRQSPGASSRTSTSSIRPTKHGQSYQDTTDVSSVSTSDQNLLKSINNPGTAIKADDPTKAQNPSGSMSGKSSKPPSLLRKVFTKKNRKS